METYIIGICGYATSGKDTFAKIAKEISEKKYDANCQIFSLAQSLKEIANPFINKHLNINIFNCSKEQKEMIRPFMVGIGESFRNFNPKFWIEKVDDKIKKFEFEINPFDTKDLNIIFIPDIRYENEANWLKSFKNNALVGIDRKNIKSPNEQESKNLPILFNNFITHKIDWLNIEHNVLTNKHLSDIVEETLENIICKNHIKIQ